MITIGTVYPCGGCHGSVGYPTANVNLTGNEDITTGCYAVRTKWLGGPWLIGFAQIGIMKKSVEVHILDFDGDLQGTKLIIEYRKHLRGLVRYKDMDAVKTQMQQDEKETRQYFETLGG